MNRNIITTSAMAALCLGIILGAEQSAKGANSADITADFANPPLKYHTTPLYWLNGKISNVVIDSQLTAFRDKDGYGSVAILPFTEWHESEFMEKYGHLLDKLDQLGMWAIFCDDQNFPSGTAGGEISKSYPEFCSRQINKAEQDVTGPKDYQADVPAGALMGCVAMNNDDHAKRIDITARVGNGKLSWKVPAGNWKIMMFNSRRDFAMNRKDPNGNLDYLNPAAVDKWISLTYQRFYDKFPTHFGTTIKSSFYDDISLYQASPDVWNGNDRRCWTDGYNAEFQKKFGTSPVEYYPAMWYDIGPSTAAARSMLFGLRAELLSEVFVKRVAAWCAAHKIDASGHPAGDYEVSPMGFSGDAIKFYKHAQRPLLDVIGGYGSKRDGYKLSSSAAFLYDKPILQCETYGAFENWKEANFTPDLLYRTAMELYARGINLIIPHGVWYAHPNVPTPPEISWRNPIVAASLPDYNTWAARCQIILQGGRHVADIAVLYPITAIYADCYFGQEGTDPEYLNVGERLTHRIRRDFTFMHPEVLEDKCTVDKVNHTLNLENAVNYERYKVLILPGKHDPGAINLSTLQKAKDFYDRGGTIISTARLPVKSAELGHDALVVKIVRDIFGLDPNKPGHPYTKTTNANGGKAYFVPNIDEVVEGSSRLAAVLNEAEYVWDVRFEDEIAIKSAKGKLSYIHKVRDDVDYYFFANSSDDAINTWVRLKGRLKPELWDPHTGAIGVADSQNIRVDVQDVTRVRVKLDANKSVFVRTSGPAAR
jgi:putative intracellular protease/amidase